MADEQILAHAGIMQMKLQHQLTQLTAELYGIDQDLEKLTVNRKDKVIQINQLMGSINALQQLQEGYNKSKEARMEELSEKIDAMIASKEKEPNEGS